MQRRHEVGKLSRHAELYFEFPSGEDERVLVRDGDEAEESGGFRRAPFAACAVRKGHHYGLELFAADLEFADALEFHRLAREVFFRGDCVGEDVEEEGAGAGGVDSERYRVADHGLEIENCNNFFLFKNKC